MKYWISGFIALTLALILTSAVEKLDSQLGEISGMNMVFPLVFIFIYMLFHLLLIPFTSAKNKQEEIKGSEVDTTDSNSDLYLRKTNCTYNLRNYQIDNRKKETVWHVKCFFCSSGIESIELYTFESSKEKIMIAARDQDTKLFLISDKESPLGYLSIEDTGLIIRDLDMKTKVSFEEESYKKNDTESDAKIIELITLIPSSHNYGKLQPFTIKGADNTLLGKYYPALHNIDLAGIKNERDQRICIIASVVIDASFTVKCYSQSAVFRLFQ